MGATKARSFVNEEVLHTKSDWIVHKNFMSNLNLDLSPLMDMSAAIAACEYREKLLYVTFGCQNFE
jgi:hypothetical protein